jgi:DNA polymerase III sliding clamp (beta) subunit (PCNA family)
VKVAGVEDEGGDCASDVFEACIRGELAMPFKMKLNSDYLLDAIGAAGTESVQLRFSAVNGPLMIQPEGAVSPRSDFLIMPMRL